MSANHCPVAIKSNRNELSCDKLVYEDIIKVDTWPYSPVESLRQGLQADCMSPDELLRLKNEEYELINECVHQFSEKQKTAIGWILAATIGVLGNLAVSIGFSPLNLSGNVGAMLVVLAGLSLLVFVYFLFLQKVSVVLKFIGPNVSFPAGYEKYVIQSEKQNTSSSGILEFGTLGEITTSFGSLVRTALLKRNLNPILDKANGIRLSDVRDVSTGLSYYFLEFSTKNIRIWADPHGKEKIQSDLKDVVDAMLKTRQMCSVYGFELDSHEWTERGPRFVEVVSAWKLDEVQSAIIDQMRPRPSKGVKIYRVISRKYPEKNKVQ